MASLLHTELVTAGIGILLALIVSSLLFVYRTVKSLPPLEKGVVAFFHPFAHGGGGGERVLWCAVDALQQAAPRAKIVIYVQDGVSPAQLVQDASSRFNVRLQGAIQVRHLTRTKLILPESYPSFTLLRQAVGAVVLGYEALDLLVPEVFIDTTGWAFTYPLAKLAGCKVACYTHYPTVSTNMLGRVWSQQAMYNNDESIRSSTVKSLVKVLYYQLFALVYGLAGACADVVMVNSSWTSAHIQQLWWSGSPPALVYPPCDTSDLQLLPLDRKLKHLYLVSVAQFRPEKNHRLQLEAFALARQRAAESGSSGRPDAVLVASLKFIGGCRGLEDEVRLKGLQAYAEELGLAEHVQWYVNAPYGELKQLLGGAVGGLHTMLDEHFGISVVEYMAAGVIPIAHNSGGPQADIVVDVETAHGPQCTGFLATTLDEYCQAITTVLEMEQRDRLKIAAAAQQRASTMFSTEQFHRAFTQAIAPVLPTNSRKNAVNVAG